MKILNQKLKNVLLESDKYFQIKIQNGFYKNGKPRYKKSQEIPVFIYAAEYYPDKDEGIMDLNIHTDYKLNLLKKPQINWLEPEIEIPTYVRRQFWQDMIYRSYVIKALIEDLL